MALRNAYFNQPNYEEAAVNSSKTSKYHFVVLGVWMSMIIAFVGWRFIGTGSFTRMFPVLYYANCSLESRLHCGKCSGNDACLARSSNISKSSKQGPTIILLWTYCDWKASWHHDPYLDRISWNNSLCQRDDCILTNNHSLVKKADILMFHCTETDVNRLPHIRYSHQIYVLYCEESPYYSNLTKFNGLMNMTATYRLDSDIVVKYYSLAPKKDAFYTPRVPLQNKTRSVVWVASNCWAPSKRQEYIAELSKYIDVDIYGYCGTKKCMPKLLYSDKCVRDFENTYKFYIAFENSICKDYVTEKLFVPLKYELVPLVMGGANYSQHAPRHSYINVEDFKSPKQLAQYLKILSENEVLYYKFFKWKSDFSVVLHSHRQLFCDLCRLAKNGDLKNFHKTYVNMDTWHGRDQCDNSLVDKLIRSE